METDEINKDIHWIPYFSFSLDSLSSSSSHEEESTYQGRWGKCQECHVLLNMEKWIDCNSDKREFHVTLRNFPLEIGDSVVAKDLTGSLMLIELHI